VGGTVRFHVPAGEAFLPEFVRSVSFPLQAISVRRPTLDDVFLRLTGRAIRDGDDGSGLGVGGAEGATRGAEVR